MDSLGYDNSVTQRTTAATKSLMLILTTVTGDLIVLIKLINLDFCNSILEALVVELSRVVS